MLAFCSTSLTHSPNQCPRSALVLLLAHSPRSHTYSHCRYAAAGGSIHGYARAHTRASRVSPDCENLIKSCIFSFSHDRSAESTPPPPSTMLPILQRGSLPRWITTNTTTPPYWWWWWQQQQQLQQRREAMGNVSSAVGLSVAQAHFLLVLIENGQRSYC